MHFLSGCDVRLGRPARFGPHSRFRIVRALIVSALVVVTGPGTAAALDGAQSISQYVHDKWTSEQGLPQNTVDAILQTRDGYLWLATWEGIVRFDGARFVTFDSSSTPALGSNIIQALFEDEAGDLWIGTRGGGLTRRHAGRFETLTTRDGLPSNFVNAIVEDQRHDLWIGTEAGLCRLSNGRITPVRAADGLPGDTLVNALVLDRSGVLWIATSGSGLVSFHNGRFTTRLNASRGGAVLSLLEGHDGTMWVGSSRGLHGIRNDQVTTYSQRDGLPQNRITARRRRRA